MVSPQKRRKGGRTVDFILVVLEGVTLRAGSVNVPLRSRQARGDAGPLQHRALPESGTIELTLCVAKDAQFPNDQ